MGKCGPITATEAALLITAVATLATSVTTLIRACQSYKILKQGRTLDPGE